MTAWRGRSARRRLHPLPIIGFLFISVFAGFAAGPRLYDVALAWWPLLLVWLLRLLLVGAVAVFALGAWWLWWGVPKHQVDRMRLRDPKERADAEDNIRKTIGQLIGGGAVLVGAAFAYLQFQQQQTSAHDLLISNQVAKGFELLGNKDNQIQQRLGGIYALEGVMNTSKEYYQPVLDALCAFIRDKAAETSKEAIGSDDIRVVASDLRAALDVIGRRALLGEAVPDLRRVRFPAKADLTNVKLINANLSGANLSGADLSKADLSGARLSGADLSGAKLNGANLSGADLGEANLSGANLYGANLSAAKLFKADLSKAGLSDANLRGANLSGANLSGAGLSRANLSAAILIRANLSGAALFANLSGANLSGANLSKAGLSDANLSGANLFEAHFLTQQELDKACGTGVMLDAGLKIKPCP